MTPTHDELLELRLAVKSSGEIIFTTDTEGIFTHVNPEFTRLYGYESAEVVGRSTPRLLKSGRTTREQYEMFWRDLSQRRVVRGEFVNKTKDGKLLRIQGSASPIIDDGGRLIGFLGVQRDITETRRVETALADSARQYQVLANAAEDSIFIVDRSQRIQYSNEAGAAKFGMRAADIVGKQLQEVFPPIVATEMWRELSAVFASGIKRLCEQRFDAPAGDLWLETWLAPIVNGAGECRSVMGIARDVTERKVLERQFLQAQKMEAVGRLAGGIAHDFNNLLTAILGYAELVYEGLHTAPELRADVAEIRKAGERAGRLTRQLLAFTRKQVRKPQLTDVSAVIADARNMVQRVVGEDIELSVAFEEATWPIVADPGQIEQVLLNLVVNARDAMPKGGSLRVTTANVDLDAAAARKYSEGKSGRHVRLAVQDAGCGMTAEVIAHVFEPFFTTKPAGKGTGLGLATVYGIVKQNGGWIAIDSAAGCGTTVSIFWPIDEGECSIEPVPMRADGADSDLAGTETVLLVEDEPGIRGLIRRTLKSHGYHVLEAPGGAQAIAAAEAHSGRIDMLLTDIVMPGMSGPDLAQRLIGSRPGLKVLYVSGYPNNFSSVQHLASGRLWLLAKPFTQLTLAQTVRQCLNAEVRCIAGVGTRPC